MNIVPEKPIFLNQVSCICAVVTLARFLAADDHGDMIQRFLPLALLLPIAALAIEIAPADPFVDVRQSSPDAAGINLLTREGIVQGYGDRRFGPTRLINRAEFLKIAILASPDNYVVSDGESCFPDTHADDWFSPYVCAAKAAGIVSGHADPALPQSKWLFRPTETVTYDAALKMLVLLFRYPVPNIEGTDWAEPYYQAAKEKGTDLPVRIRFDTPLTRAAAARLAGAFLAESEGKLDEYRLAESGIFSSSSSSSSSVSSSASSVTSSSSSSSSSSAQALFTLPPVSHFLHIGEASDAIASGMIRSDGETSKVAIAQVKLFTEARSIEKLEIVTGDGELIATLLRRTTTDVTDYKLTYEAQITPESRFVIPADTDVDIVLRAVIRDKNNNGFSEDLVHVRTFTMSIHGQTSNETRGISFTGPFPKHQTSFGSIASVSLASPQTAALGSGTDALLGSFTFSGTAITGSTLSLRHLLFSVRRTGSVDLTNWIITNKAKGMSESCSFNETAMTVTCANIQSFASLDPASPLTLDLRADIAVADGDEPRSVEVFLDAAGSPEELGSIQWTDGSGLFRWVDLPSPVVRGTSIR